MNAERLPFIDWMKFLGMLVIVYGHTAGDSTLRFTEPFNPKQLGVAFFVFVMGFSLARETRPPWRAVYNRLFEILLFGWAFALLMSFVAYFQIGNLQRSNYLPLLGLNLVQAAFPANPTTWYIGAYAHLLLLWCLVLRRWRVRLWQVALVALLEVPLRAWLIAQADDFRAYMSITNWASVYLLGAWYGQCWAVERRSSSALLPYVTALVALVTLWPLVTARFVLGEDFPFKRLEAGGTAATLMLTSASISFLYLAHAWLVFQITRRLGDDVLVRLCARNTIFVFIAHMPLFYALYPYINERWPPNAARVLLNLSIYYFGLVLLSEAVCRGVQPKRLRDATYAALAAWGERFSRRTSAAGQTPERSPASP